MWGRPEAVVELVKARADVNLQDSVRHIDEDQRERPKLQANTTHIIHNSLNGLEK